MESAMMVPAMEAYYCAVETTNPETIMLAVKETMDTLSGKWKILIVGTLIFSGKKRFMELLRDVKGIAAKMLSKELHELESQNLVSRTVCDTKPITVEYEITPYGKTLDKIILSMMQWRMEHKESLVPQSLLEVQD